MQISNICLFNASEIWNATLQENTPFPFNVRFVQRENFNEQPLTGPGIYMISFLQDGIDKVIYVGSYKCGNVAHPNNSIVTQRWDKHIESDTMRGTRTTFGNRNIQNYLNLISGTVLEDVFTENYIAQNNGQGFNVTDNRTRFVIENWEASFAQHPEEWINRFKFKFIQLSCLPHENLNAVQQDQILLELEENFLIPRINAECNGRYPYQQERYDFDVINEPVPLADVEVYVDEGLQRLL